MKIEDDRFIQAGISAAVMIFLGGCFMYFTISDSMSREILVRSLETFQVGVFSSVWIIGVFVCWIAFPVYAVLHIGNKAIVEFEAESKIFRWTEIRRRRRKSYIVNPGDLEIRELRSGIWISIFGIRSTRYLLKSPNGSVILPNSQKESWDRIIQEYTQQFAFSNGVNPPR